MTLQNGATIAGRYRLLRLIATGGMGEVWEAIDGRLDRRVAVKVLKAELSADPEFLERFRAEARTTARLNHPGIAGVYDYGETADPSGASVAYLVMELVRGEPLSSVLRRMGAVPLEHTLDMLEQTGRALQVAHTAGLVHRDVKPGNILITPTGEVKITDFGIAKAIDAAPVTRTGMVMGTAQYISPEQALGQDATAASDVYSLGVVGYEALTGRRPFSGDGTITVAMKHVREAPEPLPDDIPPHVRELIDTALSKDPASRYPNGGTFADAVAAVRAGHRPPPPGSAAAAAAGAAAATRTRAMGSSTRMMQAPPPPTGRPAAAAAPEPPKRGMSPGQKALAWGAGILLVVAVLVAIFLIVTNLPGSRNLDNPATTAPVPTLDTTQPEPTTQAPQTTTPPPTTTSAPPTTTETTKEPTTVQTTPPSATPSPTPTRAPGLFGGLGGLFGGDQSPADQPSATPQFMIGGQPAHQHGTNGGDQG